MVMSWNSSPKGIHVDADVSTRVRRSALGAIAGISSILSLNVLSAVLERGTSVAVALGVVVLLAVLLGLQTLHCFRALRASPGTLSVVPLLIQSILTFAPLPVMRAEWAGISGLLVGAFLVALNGRYSWILAGAVGVVQASAAVPFPSEMHISFLSLLITFSTGLAVFGVMRLARLADRLHAARQEDAQIAVINERLRFARDLHDLVGYSLSTAATKSELAYRLIERSPAGARVELSQAIEMIRGTHAEMRKVAHDHHHLSLERELESAQSVLEAAGIESRFSFIGVDFTHHSSSVLAAVLREGISNVLKHSAASYCVVRLFHRNASVRLVIINDGPTLGVNGGVISNGVGLRSLSERVVALRGSLDVSRRGSEDRQEFMLEAVVPDIPDRFPRIVRQDRAAVSGRSRLIAWTTSDPALPHRDPDGVDPVPGA
ncbi:sensor histidine kinase [Streptomyces sp. NPDC059255]|uniref:sensor histidine kinase n=1 Tax=Streptomyces sp. NPDC059255 TaxID=3346793 RepID=UPI0036A706C9